MPNESQSIGLSAAILVGSVLDTLSTFTRGDCPPRLERLEL